MSDLNMIVIITKVIHTVNTNVIHLSITITI
jgi:hypothetical protein